VVFGYFDKKKSSIVCL